MKIIKKMLILILVSFTLVGCGKGDDQGNEDLKVVVVINTNLGDNSFSDLVWNGVKRTGDDMKFETKAIELMGDPTKQIPTLQELSESGEWDVIVSGTYNLKEAIEKVSVEYPEQKFIVFDTELDYTDGAFPNTTSVMSKQNEGSFLAGALAALMTTVESENTNDDKVIGFVGGVENTAINDFLVGYIEGAKYIDPSTRVLFSYIGDFTNTAKAKELTVSQYQQGADIVFAVAGSASLGVLDAAKTENKYAIGVDNDHAMVLKETDIETSKHIISSALKNLDVILYDKLKEYVDGAIQWGNHKAAGLAENGVSLAKNEFYEELVPVEIREKMEEIERKIISGEITVPTAIGMSTEDVNAIKARGNSTN